MPRRDYDSDLDLPPRRRRRRRKPDSSSTVILLCVGGGLLLLLLVGAAVGAYIVFRAKPDGSGVATGPGASDLERLAGTWECTFRDPTGRVNMHKVKQITGTTETATWYRPDGSVFRVNRVE